jgi:hypothetical protein
MSTTCDEFIKIIRDSKIGAKSSRGEYKVAVKNSIKLLGVTRIADVYNLPVTLVTRSTRDRNNTKRMMKGLKSAMAYLPEACKAQIHGDNLRQFETYVEFLKMVESTDNTDKDIMHAIERETKYLMNIQVDQNVHIDQPDTNDPDEYPDEFNPPNSSTLDDSLAGSCTYMEPVTNGISEGDSPNEPSSDNGNGSPCMGRTSSLRMDYSSDEESIEEMLSEKPRLPILSQKQSKSVDVDSTKSKAVDRYVQQTELEMSRLRRLIRERDSTIQLQNIKHTRALSENDNIITALKNDMRDMIAHWQEILNKY